MEEETPKATRFYIVDSIRDKLGVLLSNPPNEECNTFVVPILVDSESKKIPDPILIDNESKKITNAWIKVFGRWAVQEGLSDDLALLFASEYMQHTDYSWARQFYVGHTWEDFVRRYFQRTNANDVEVAQEVEQFMKWYRQEYKSCRKRTSEAIRFSPRELGKATAYYSSENIIGEGEFGIVYRGHLSDFPRLVAIKRLKLVSREVLSLINVEAAIISQCRHPHLVRLIGWCLDTNDPLLVYEYLPNGGLREHLDGLHGIKLNWGTRMKIAVETAQALTYLHNTFDTIHGDVNSSNILLDQCLSAKVADFGISKRLPTNLTHLNIITVGSPGYVDPHYLQNYEFTFKSDVYSFGVVLLELVSGLQVLDTQRPRNKLTLAALGISRAKSHRVSELFEPYLIQTGTPPDLRQWKKVALLALQCVRVDPESRPNMKEVLDTLRELSPKSLIIYPMVPGLHKPNSSTSESSLKSMAWGFNQQQHELLPTVDDLDESVKESHESGSNDNQSQ